MATGHNSNNKTATAKIATHNLASKSKWR